MATSSPGSCTPDEMREVSAGMDAGTARRTLESVKPKGVSKLHWRSK